MARGGRAEAPGPHSDVNFRLDQKKANFKVAFASREMQWSFSTEEKQKNQLAQTGYRFIKTITLIRAVAITRRPSLPHQRCTAAKNGKLQGGLREQPDAVEFLH